MNNLFDKIQPLLYKVKNPSRYIGSEYNSLHINAKSDDFNFCMVYPDIYDIGQSNNAVSILCNYINHQKGFSAQRSYLPHPETISIFKDKNIPMFSLESSSPLSEFDAVGITVSHELLATNILEVLDFSNISIFSQDRDNNEPFIFGGGPMCCNPEPYHAFYDVITIGEGEEATINCLKELKKLKNQGLSREEILHKLSKLESIYVPSMYVYDKQKFKLAPRFSDVPTCINKAVYKDFSKSHAYINTIVPYAQITHNRLSIEILRGCNRGCRFCQAGFMYRPVRERNEDNICKSVEIGLNSTGFDELSLVSLSTTDHSQIKKILEQLNKNFASKDISISIPSQRLDSFGVDMANLIAGNKKSGLTFAPEAGSQRLRDVINKNVSEKDLYEAIRSSFDKGWNRVKLYFMIGLPTETDDDVLEIAKMCNKALKIARDTVDKKRKNSVVIAVSCAIFIPKAQTPFMWDGQISQKEARRRIALIKKNIASRQIKFRWHDTDTCLIEAVLSRGGRECSNLIFNAWKNGARFDAWNEYFNFSAWLKSADNCNLSLYDEASKNLDFESHLPWNHIHMGVSKEYFVSERVKAKNCETTKDCTFDKCSDCGVCSTLKFNNMLAGIR